MTHQTTTNGTADDTASVTTASPHAERTPGLVPRSIAEGVGAFLIVLAGLGATMLATETALQPPLVFGFAVVAAMIAFGFVSGGHFNPAITIGSAVAGRTAWTSVAPYVVAQVLGAVGAAGLLWLVLSANAQLSGIREFFSSASNGFGEHSPAQFPLAGAFLLEVVATALLVAVFLGAGSARARRDLAPFAVGLAYAGLLSFLLPVTNGGLNPVRATASAVFAETWALEQLWLFWAAPIVGALIAGLVFRSVDAWDPNGRSSRRVADRAPAAIEDTAPTATREQQGSSDGGPAAPAAGTVAAPADGSAVEPPAAPAGGSVAAPAAGSAAGPGAAGEHREDAASFFDAPATDGPDSGSPELRSRETGRPADWAAHEPSTHDGDPDSSAPKT